METNRTTRTVGRNVAATITRTATPLDIISKTAGITAAHLNARLHGETDFTCAELYMIGRATRTHPADFLAGAA